MKKVLLLGLLTMLCFRFVAAQKPVVDSLKRAYQKNKQDTTLVKLLDVKSIITFVETNTDSGMICARQGLAISRRIHYTYGEVRSLANIAHYLNVMGDLPGALRISFKVLPKAVAINETYTIGECYNTLGSTYHTLNDLKKSNEYYHKALIYAFKSHINEQVFAEYNNLSRNFLEKNMLDSALWYTNKAYTLATEKHLDRHIGFSIRNFGIIQFKKGNYSRAINFYNKSLAQKASSNNHNLRSEDLRLKAEAYQKINKLDSCIYFAEQAYEEAKLERSPKIMMNVTSLLTNAFKSKNDYRRAYEYQQIMLKAQDSLFNQQKTLQVKNLEYSELQRQEEIKAAEAEYQNSVRFYALLTVIGVFVLIALFLLYSNRARQKANKRLHLQNQQIQAQQKALEETLTELKSTQTQLIQREKMASLGELTAGIAHEIQNPLNFVNNFSDVNKEMLEELKAEGEKPKAEWDEKLVAELINDLIENEQKINHHGKRADNIVKGMLEHSRVSTGEKQLTDLNALADEFLKLAYHGLLAKDKGFNAVPVAIGMITHFDENLPAVNIIPQDISRVMLNIFNNAFYAVNQKAKTAEVDYKPAIEVTSFFLPLQGVVGLKFKDNGNGIPDAIKDKIMQPFFTTKPTGEGTGLGLSMSYDIVVKGHGGSIDVITKEGEFTEFIIRLPI